MWDFRAIIFFCSKEVIGTVLKYFTKKKFRDIIGVFMGYVYIGLSDFVMKFLFKYTVVNYDRQIVISLFMVAIFTP